MLWVSASLVTGFASAPPVYFTVWNMQRGNQQRLAEPAGTAQEIIIGSTVCHTVNIFRLIYIKVVPLYDFLKSLYSYRASLQLLLFHRFIVFLIVLQRNKIVSDNPNRETYFILKRLASKNDVYSKESRHTTVLQ